MLLEKKGYVPIFGVEYTIIVYREPQELIDYMDGFDFENRNIQDYDGCVFVYDDTQYLTLRKLESNGITYPTAGIIAHEAKHLVNNVFIDIGQRLDEHNDEVECYLLGWFVDIIHELLNTHK